MTGRPSDFTQEIADTICEHIADGRSLRAICADDDMPSKSTVCRWLARDEAFRDQYAHAREMQADSLFDDCLDIADGRRAMREGCDPDVQRDRLAVDTRKWMAGKLKGKYSDRSHLDVNASVAFTGLDVLIKR